MQIQGHKHMGTQDLSEVQTHYKVVPMSIVEATTMAFRVSFNSSLFLATTKISREYY
jgi:hypothetical protein